VGKWKSELEMKKVGSGKVEVGIRKKEVGSGKVEVGIRNEESRKWEGGSRN
jgi:hypothetical protein